MARLLKELIWKRPGGREDARERWKEGRCAWQ